MDLQPISGHYSKMNFTWELKLRLTRSMFVQKNGKPYRQYCIMDCVKYSREVNNETIVKLIKSIVDGYRLIKTMATHN
jgi:hypothetical protein